MSNPANTVLVESLYGHTAQEPRVNLRLGELKVQMSSEEARSVATSLILASFASDADAFVYDFARDTLACTPSEGAIMLAEFRQWREKRVAELASVQDANAGDPTARGEVNGG